MSRPVAVEPDGRIPSRAADRARIRAATRERRRAEAAELRRPAARPRHRAVLLGVLLVAAVLVGMPAVLTLSPVFAFRTVDVQGASPAVAAEVRARLVPLTGTPLALVDSADVAHALAAVPAVARWRIARLPPHTLQLEVVQRIAVAQQHVDGAWRTVDASGVVLGTSAQQDGALPEVRASGAALDAALAVLPALPAAVLARVSYATAAAPDDVRLQLGGAPGTQVVWGGTDDAAAKAAALTAALAHVGAKARIVDVSSPGLVRIR